MSEINLDMSTPGFNLFLPGPGRSYSGLDNNLRSEQTFNFNLNLNLWKKNLNEKGGRERER